MKTCKTCLIKKPFSDFYSRPMMKDGHSNLCKCCSKARAKLPVVAQKRREYARKYFHEVVKHTRKWKDRMNARKRRAYHLNPQKQKARGLLARALKRGQVFKLPCSVCSQISPIEAHHHDYLQPLNVVWLCPLHHRQLHPDVYAIKIDSP